jgi:LacI family transcriptional regulator
MQDIADDLNLSVVTVSKVLRRTGKFSLKTRERVLQRAKELDYRANWAARSLVTRRTLTIGLLLPDFRHSFFAEIAETIAHTLRPLHYHVITSYFDEDPEMEKDEAEALIDRQVDGLIIASSQPSADAPFFERMRKSNLPLVLIDRLIEAPDFNFVGVDNRKIGKLAAEHLLAQNCHRIACLRGPMMRIADDRLGGCRQALETAGLDLPESNVVLAGYADVSGYEAMRKLLNTQLIPDGVVCFNDPVAIGAIRAIRDAGLNVPRDVAVVGAGNIHYSDLLVVPLTTIDQGTRETGKRAAELLFAQITSKDRLEAKTMLIAPKLVVRQSSQRMAANAPGLTVSST